MAVEPYAFGKTFIPPIEDAIIKPDIDYLLPKDYFFVMGDNRSKSSDSREWGMVRKNDILRRVIAHF